jgi:hypothetical protein
MRHSKYTNSKHGNIYGDHNDKGGKVYFKEKTRYTMERGGYQGAEEMTGVCSTLQRNGMLQSRRICQL